MESENRPIEETKITEGASLDARKSGFSLPGAIIIAAIIIAGAIFMNKSSSFSGDSETDPLDLVSDVTDADVVRGNEKAEITIIEYADFSCHFCAQYHPTLQRIVGESEGRIRWVYRHLPIFNREAAVASSCVARLGGDELFWKYADMLYVNTDKFSADFYRAGATELGIDGESYDKCLRDPLLGSKIDREFAQARLLLGFNATPYTILIDKEGRKFSFAGALPYAELSTAIDGLAK